MSSLGMVYVPAPRRFSYLERVCCWNGTMARETFYLVVKARIISCDSLLSLFHNSILKQGPTVKSKDKRL